MSQPPYIVDYYMNVLKRNDFPPLPQLPTKITLRFHDKTRDNFFDLANESLKRKIWEKPIILQSQMQAQQQQPVATRV